MTLRTTLINDRHGLDGIMKTWRELQNGERNPVPDVDLDHYLSELEGLAQQAEPHILCVHRDGRIVSMLIGRRQEFLLPVRVGYLTIMTPRLASILVYRGGLLGEQTRQICSFLLGTLRDSLKGGVADMAMFNHFPLNSVLTDLIRSDTSPLCLGHFQKTVGHWRMEIPRSMAEFYLRLSKKHVGNLKRQVAKLESKHQIQLKTYRNEDQLTEGIRAAASISSRTYQCALGCGFVDTPLVRNTLLSESRHGWLRLDVLYIDGQAAAYQHGMEYKTTYFLERIGFDPKWSTLCIGTTLFMKVLQRVCEETSIEYMDFGFGNSQYKERYGDSKTDTSSQFIFAERLRPIIVNSAHTSALGLSLAGSWVAGRLGIEHIARRRWRDRLSRQFALTDAKGKDGEAEDGRTSDDPNL
jgi:hypothetical protein